MPLSQPRLALAGILLSFIASLAVFTGAAKAAPPPEQNPIVARALQDVGTHGGQCWTWMQRVVFEATGMQVGFDYRLGFFEAGAVEVSIEVAGPGDVIQMADDDWTSPDADYPGLHTAIIIENLGDGGFTVIDSNANYDEMVNIREGVYRPLEIAAARGVDVHIYRFGEVAERAPAPAPKPGEIEAGDAARVNTHGDVLNFRSRPGIDSDIIGKLPDGTSVTVLEDPFREDGYTWVKVRTDIGDGYVAAEYLVRSTATAPASGPGDARPILLYRTYAVGVTANSD